MTYPFQYTLADVRQSHNQACLSISYALKPFWSFLMIRRCGPALSVSRRQQRRRTETHIQNETTGVTQVWVHVSTYQGFHFGTVFVEPQPHRKCSNQHVSSSRCQGAAADLQPRGGGERNSAAAPRLHSAWLEEIGSTWVCLFSEVSGFCGFREKPRKGNTMLVR